MRKSLIAASLLTVVVAVAPACATKKFVRTEVGNVNSKVDTLTKTVEDTQERTRQNETRIGAVDAKAEAAGRSATDARAAAGTAQKSADAAAATAKQVGTRVENVASEVAAGRKLIYTVTLSEGQGNFKFGGAELPDEAKSRIDQMVASLKTDPKNIYLEIEGHTDNVGSADYNQQLGLERAESVKRYLYQQHQIPLHKISVISYGEDRPAVENNNRDGRAQNRRVVIRVLS